VESDYIITTANDRQALDTAAWIDLYKANFTFNKPFSPPLSDGTILYCEQVVRMMPKKRMVVFGTWQHQPVAAKLFFDPRHSKRHADKDAAGIKLLKNNKVPTPDLLFEGLAKDEHIHVLILERITNAQSLDEVWRNRQDMEEVLSDFKSVIIEIATQHVLGLLQHDLHLKNFLVNEKTVFTLDGAQIQTLNELLSKPVSMNNLALFLSQLGVNVEVYQELLFKHYAKARGWSLKKEDYLELFADIKRWNQVRWKSFEKKIYRDSTDFCSKDSWRSVGMYARAYEGPELMAFLKTPEAIFELKTAEFLKKGNSATVIKVQMDGRDYVVKRYNIKNKWHAVRRCLRETRASQAWRFGQKLGLFNVATAKPVAFVERNFMGFRGTSYFVSEYISEENVGDYFAANTNITSIMVENVSRLLKSLAKINMTHGDLKMTNILIDSKAQPVLIDLDGAVEHHSGIGLKKAWKHERARFLKNFDGYPDLRHQLEEALKN